MITVPRFEKTEVDREFVKRMFDTKTTIAIKDHKIDVIIAMINLTNNQEENLELADLIIETIETYLDQHESD